ncbi:MFS general substrate transporter, partial [Epithele typhae]|uniref:MFS general substrate transporter n=1 Tax=Epithele typhae TaxID=378194 RepID=UPI0020074048
RGLARRLLASAHEAIDPRITPCHVDAEKGEPDISSDDQVKNEKFLASQHTTTADETIYVDFDNDDPHNPANFSHKRKWAITFAASFFSIAAASTSGAYALGLPSMTRDLNATQYEAIIGLSMFTLGFGLVPLLLTSFSEEFGRQPIYLVSGIGCVVFHIMTGLAHNIQTVIIGRFLCGAFASTASAMVGGTIADIWAPSERGLPMSLFATMVLSGPGVGCVAAGWIEQNPHLEWRWIQYIHAMYLERPVLAHGPTLMKETRSGVLLMRLARKLRAQTGNSRYRARIEDERASLRTLIYISCTRPMYLLFTEPVVAAFSLWAGFAWGILYVLIESIGPAFRTIHNFNQGEVGTVFVAMIVGCLAGELLQIYQEKLYARYHPSKGPEARLFSACLAAVLSPAGMFIYGWCTSPSVPWIGMVMGIFVIMMALFIIYVAVFTYLADWHVSSADACVRIDDHYGPFASSALAGQSLSRNMMGTIFPLFTTQLFDAVGYPWGTSLFAFIGVVMIPIPFVLLWKGPAIRARSKFASQVVHTP